MKLSLAFHMSRRGQKGRRKLRHLDDEAIMRAQLQSLNVEHQMKFMSPMKRFAVEYARRILRGEKP